MIGVHTFDILISLIAAKRKSVYCLNLLTFYTHYQVERQACLRKIQNGCRYISGTLPVFRVDLSSFIRPLH
jgi:hypothetical protein